MPKAKITYQDLCDEESNGKRLARRRPMSEDDYENTKAMFFDKKYKKPIDCWVASFNGNMSPLVIYNYNDVVDVVEMLDSADDSKSSDGGGSEDDSGDDKSEDDSEDMPRFDPCSSEAIGRARKIELFGLEAEGAEASRLRGEFLKCTVGRTKPKGTDAEGIIKLSGFKPFDVAGSGIKPLYRERAPEGDWYLWDLHELRSDSDRSLGHESSLKYWEPLAYAYAR